MQFKEGMGWKACYDEKTGRFTAEEGGCGNYCLYELTQEQFDLLEDGMNVFQISKMLGHACVETTMVYLGVTVSMTDKAIRKIESTAARSVKPVWKKNVRNLQDLF